MKSISMVRQGGKYWDDELNLCHNNHNLSRWIDCSQSPGVMTHICGLFARRAFNVDGILCLPMKIAIKAGFGY